MGGRLVGLGVRGLGFENVPLALNTSTTTWFSGEQAETGEIRKADGKQGERTADFLSVRA